MKSWTCPDCARHFLEKPSECFCKVSPDPFEIHAFHIVNADYGMLLDLENGDSQRFEICEKYGCEQVEYGELEEYRTFSALYPFIGLRKALIKDIEYATVDTEVTVRYEVYLIEE